VVLNPAVCLIKNSDTLERLVDVWELPRTARERLKSAGGAGVMLYRAQGRLQEAKQHAPSSIGFALFTPALDLVYRRPLPVLEPIASFHNLGVEDPRCTIVHDTFFVYYTGYSSDPERKQDPVRRIQICLATTKDFIRWRLLGPVAGDINRFPNKNGALLPRTINGKWLLLHRPMEGPDNMTIHLAEADEPSGPWYTRGKIMTSFPYREFRRSWIGAGGPPLHISENRFLMIYHQGHFTDDGRREYDLAATIIDFSSDQPVHRRIEPLMRPTEPLEQYGDAELGVDNVLFTCANYIWGDQVIVPYTGADSRIFGASISLDDLLTALDKGCS